MNLYDNVSLSCSKMVTNRYSTSFSLAVMLLDKKFRDPIYAIYGFVRIADEIVDTFYGYNQREMLTRFKNEAYTAIEEGISTNPILHSFQAVVRKYGIEKESIDAFLGSMEMDLNQQIYSPTEFQQYVFGSAEAVGLMCLKVFTEGNDDEYQRLKAPARKLGEAFQKVNFLRDLKDDYVARGRSYFPNVNFASFDNSTKRMLEADIEKDFQEAFLGIQQLPSGAKLGVYLAFRYYRILLQKIKDADASEILGKRYSVSSISKAVILSKGVIRERLGIL